MRSAYVPHQEDNDFIQPGNFYRQVLSQTKRDHLVSNIVGYLSKGVEHAVQERTVALWRKVDSDLGERIAQGIGLTTPSAQATPVHAD